MDQSMYNDGKYLENNPNWHEEDSPYKASLILDIISKCDIDFHSIADVGCGSGRVAEIISQRLPDVSVYGFDISADASSFWQQRSGPEYHQEDFLTSDRHVDLSLCLDVFEHVEDYYAFLRLLRNRSNYVLFNIPLDLSILKAAGPGIRRARRVTGHLHYFNDYTALETLKDCGYEVLHSKLATPVMSTLPRNPYQFVLALPRIVLSLISKRFCARTIGGYSLAVLVKC